MGGWQQLTEDTSSEFARRILELTWPINDESVPSIIIDWSWKVSSARPGVSYRAETDFGLTRSLASFAIVDSVLATVSVNTTDIVDEAAADGKQFLRDAFAQQVGTVTALAGAPGKRSAGAEPAAEWMLGNGSRLAVQALKFGCSWTVTSPEFVQIQGSL